MSEVVAYVAFTANLLTLNVLTLSRTGGASRGPSH